MASLVAQTLRNPLAMRETWVRSLGWEDPLEKRMAMHSSILPGEFQGQRSLPDPSPWGHKELDMTEQLSLSPATPSCFIFQYFTHVSFAVCLLP